MAASKLCKAGAQSGCLGAFMELAACALVQELLLCWSVQGKCPQRVFLLPGCSVRLVDILWMWTPGWWTVLWEVYSCFSQLYTTSVSVCAYNLMSHQPSWWDGHQWGKSCFSFSNQHNSISSEGTKVIQTIQSSMPVCSYHTLSPRVLWNLFFALQEGRVLEKKEKERGKTHNPNSQCYSMEFIPQDRNSHTGQEEKKYHLLFWISLFIW